MLEGYVFPLNDPRSTQCVSSITLTKVLPEIAPSPRHNFLYPQISFALQNPFITLYLE
jgi:hypothetical protein